ncbi:DUF2975 domain-containing protein [Rothia nasimurium]|uniref:DUF2975 domain-containing protein n=1 Tax=Rothia nasimurium TaxID=85336 RepID=UPI001F28DEB4|nr:DUF2975 domain-containing protein [Rothia nasimurium]
MDTFARRILIATLTLFIVVLFLGQLLVPIAANESAEVHPEVLHLVTPYSTLGIASLLCFQLAAVLLRKLLGKSATPGFWNGATRALIQAVGALCVLGFVIPAGVAIHLCVTMNAGGVLILLGLVMSILAAIGFICVTCLAVRTYDKARTEHEELEAVI